jgi:hypothetical protein
VTQLAFQRLLGCLPIALAFAFLRCQVDDDLDDRVWRCAASSECGTLAGKPMTCWEGACFPSCDPESPPQAPDQCLASGVLLRGCDPSLDDEGGNAGCPDGLGCFRTDIFEETGLCVPFPVCNKATDCNGTSPPKVCAGLILAVRLGEPARARLDNLSCVELACDGGDKECDTGTRCLADSYLLDGNDRPDVCLPECKGPGHCPPNYACARTSAAPGADSICIPGLPGARCTGDLDCIVGTCVPTDAGFGICTLPCDSQADCLSLSPPPSYLWCVEPEPNAPTVCVDTSPFQGVQCDVAEDVVGEHCPPGTQCYKYSPYFPSPTEAGECRVPCDAEQRCPLRGGLAHVCLDTPENADYGGGGCYPGLFGLPCKDSTGCLAPLECLAVEPDGRERFKSEKICTLPCAAPSDAEGEAICDAEPATRTAAYCGGGMCRLRARPDKPCDRNEQCADDNPCDGGQCSAL